MTLRLQAPIVAICASLVLFLCPPVYAGSTRDRQWHIDTLRLNAAHALSQGESIIIAVIDSGVEQSHPDLAGNILPGVDIVPGGNGNGWGDKDGHGTAMTGLIVGHGHGINNSEGVLGVAPKAKVLPIRVDTAKDSTIPGKRYADGIRWAVRHGAKIISISANTSGADFDAVREAHAAGVIVVGAGGNTTKDLFIGSPARYDGYAVAVAGTDREGNHASISVAGSSIDIAAPAVEVVSTGLDGAYHVGTGTSESAAIVSGALALIWSKYPYLTRDEVLWRLLATATDKGPKGKDPETGYGLINIVAALTAEVGPPPSSAPTASSPPSSTPTPVAVVNGPARTPGKPVPLYVGIGTGLIAGITVLIVVAARRRRDN